MISVLVSAANGLMYGFNQQGKQHQFLQSRRNEAGKAEKIDIYCSIDLNSMKKTTVSEHVSVPEDSVRLASNNVEEKKTREQMCLLEPDRYISYNALVMSYR